MIFNRFYALAAALLLATTAACSREATEVPDSADAAAVDSSAEASSAEASSTDTAAADLLPDADEVAEGRYTNDYFGFTMTFPTSWAVASDETAEELQNMGSDIVAGDDTTLRASIEAAEQNSYQLLMVSEQPVGTPVSSFNPNVVVMAEKVSHLPGITSGADYLASVSALLQQTELPYQPTGEVYEVELGGKTFHRADFSLNAGGMAIQQSYLATVDQGYALGFILSGDDTSMDELEAIASSITF